MKPLTIFRILSFILIPIAAFFALLDIFMLINALVNPAFFLIVFMVACFVIYTFASLRFLTQHIDTGRPSKPSLKDWIKVNAYISLFIGTMILMNSISILASSDSSLRQIVGQMLETQPNVPALLTPEFFMKAMKIAAYFMLFMGIILVYHIFLNFRLLKQYAHLFGKQEE